MTLPAIYDNAPIGDPIYQGFTFGQTLYFTETATFEKADYPGLRAVLVELVGAGGPSGNCEATGPGQYAISGAGGGGAYARKLVLAVDLEDSVTVTVGVSMATDAPGGTSSFGDHCSAAGGGQGATGTATSTGTQIFDHGGAGGTAGVGDLVIPGGHSGPRLGIDGAGWPVPGGASVFAPQNAHNAAATGYGVGAGGRRRAPNQGSLGRLPGGPGLVVVHLLY